MGWMREQYSRLQAYRAERFLRRHPEAGIAVLRRTPDLAAASFEAFADLQGAGGPQRESDPYPVYMSDGYGGRSPMQRTLPKNTPYNIRVFSQYPPARRAIEALSNPLLQMPWSITLRRPLGAKLHALMPDPTEEQQARIVAATTMLEQPNDEHNGHEFLEMLLEDLLVLGACPFEAAPNTADTRPLFLWPVDPQSIRINMQWRPGADTYRYSQGKGFLFGSVGISDDVWFKDDQLCYPRLNSRTNSPFGFGYMEVAFDAVNSWFGALQFATRRASNDIPPFGLFLGENMTPEQVRRFQHYWENEIEGYGKIPILGGGRQPTAFSFNTGNNRDPLWVSYQEYLIRIIAMSFGLSPMKLGIERDVNRCYSTDTEILTISGWKTNDQLTEDDLIAAVNPSTEEIIFQKPKHIYRYQYDGEMVYLQSSLTDVLVTPNHRMYVGRMGGYSQHGKLTNPYGTMRFVDASSLAGLTPQFYELKTVVGVSDVTKNAELQYVTIPNVPVNSSKHYKDRPGFTVDADTFLQFLGYFLSEGSLNIGTKPIGIYRVQLCQKQGRLADKMRLAIQAMPCQFEEYVHAPTQMILWKKQHKPLCIYLLHECGKGAANKHIPAWVKLLPERQLNIVFQALMEGDGTWRTQEGWDHGFYTTASKQLADDMQEIAFKLGYRTQIAIHKDKRHDGNPKRLPLYRVLMSRRPHAIYYSRNVQMVPYAGTVWCVEVPPYGLLVTRRNGKISIHGNSTAATQSADDWSTIAPLATVLRDTFTYWVLHKRLGWTDLEFQWQVRTADELRQAQILALQYNNDAITVDELRQIYERPPLEDGLGGLTKSAYQATLKSLLAPTGAPGSGTGLDDQDESAPPPIQAARADPFGDLDLDALSPEELAFVRESLAAVTQNGHRVNCS